MAEFEARLEELLANPPQPPPQPPSSLSNELSALAALANSPQLLKSHPILCSSEPHLCSLAHITSTIDDSCVLCLACRKDIVVQCRQVLEENARAVRTGELQRKQLAEMERIHVADGVHCTLCLCAHVLSSQQCFAHRFWRARVLVLVHRTAYSV